MPPKEKLSGIHRDYEWVREIIYSCSHEGQFEITLNVIELFHKKYQDDTYFDSLKALWIKELRRLNDKVYQRMHDKIIEKYGRIAIEKLGRSGKRILDEPVHQQ